MPRSPTRRDFLKTAAAGGVALGSYPAIARALAIDPKRTTGTIKDVRHIVILMQENRSFDHYFGTMKGVRGFGDRHTVPLTGGRSVWEQHNGARVLPPFHLDTEKTNAMKVPGTPHSFSDAQAAWNQGKFGMWPKFKTDFSMGYYRREDIPFQFALAEAFTLCDAYHCSITTGTDPNRIMFWSGANFDPTMQAKGVNCRDDKSEPNNLRCWIKGALPEPGYTYQGNALEWDTIPDVLEAAGVSWKIYQDPNDNWTGAMHGGLAFKSFREAKPGSPLYEKGMRHWSLEQLAKDAADGTLPAVSWVLPPKEWSEHPSASTPIEGAEFTARVLDALTANPDTWASTVFFQTFDENDGLFDHLPPPAPPSYNAEGKMMGGATLKLDGHYFDDHEDKYLSRDDTISGTTRPWGLGPRVPLYVASPWSRGGWVNSETADHTSVGQFIEKRFGVTIPAISPWHRAVCSDLTSCFDFSDRADANFLRLPSAKGSVETLKTHLARPKLLPPRKSTTPFQEAGLRYSRALPYDLAVDMAQDDNAVQLSFINNGQAGAVFHVYDRNDLDAIPRRYTVESGKRMTADWPFAKDGAYDLYILSHNGFMRRYTGQRGAGIAVTARHVARLKSVELEILNSGREQLSVELGKDVYAVHADRRISIASGGRTRLSWSAAKSHNWYDFSIAAGGDTIQLAGRIETGKHGVSDPLLRS